MVKYVCIEYDDNVLYFNILYIGIYIVVYIWCFINEDPMKNQNKFKQYSVEKKEYIFPQ